jgi:hypothetical protein
MAELKGHFGSSDIRGGTVKNQARHNVGTFKVSSVNRWKYLLLPFGQGSPVSTRNDHRLQRYLVFFLVDITSSENVIGSYVTMRLHNNQRTEKHSFSEHINLQLDESITLNKERI